MREDNTGDFVKFEDIENLIPIIKEKPDEKGNWLRWSPIRKRWECEWVEKVNIMDIGKWVKIHDPT